MPEGPEIYNYTIWLKNKILNHELLDLQFINQHTLSLPARIISVSSYGKSIILQLSCNKSSIIISHGMTGSWSLEKNKHTRLELHFKSHVVFFNDPRKFGKIQFDTDLHKWKSRLGPNIIEKYSPHNYNMFFNKIITKKNSKISRLLLDNTIICGIGNYLRSEILWYSQIAPDTKVKSLSHKQLNTLFRNCINLTRYYAGLSYTLTITPSPMFVYMQKQDPFGNKVSQTKISSRTVHHVQPEIIGTFTL